MGKSTVVEINELKRELEKYGYLRQKESSLNLERNVIDLSCPQGEGWCRYKIIKTSSDKAN